MLHTHKLHKLHREALVSPGTDPLSQVIDKPVGGPWMTIGGRFLPLTLILTLRPNPLPKP